MSLTRRSLLGMLAVSFAALSFPAHKISTEKTKLTLYGDGVHDDTCALQAWFDNKPVFWPDGRRVDPWTLYNHTFWLNGTVDARLWQRRGVLGRQPPSTIGARFNNNDLLTGFSDSRTAPTGR